MDKDLSTLEKIMEYSKREFLEKGFKDASLRSIAATAGLTTGAIYGYFKDKNALFDALVAPVCEQVEQIMGELSTAYYTADSVVGEISKEKTIVDLHKVYGFIYEHFDIFRLLVVSAEGSSKADYVHTIVDCEVEHTLAYLNRVAGEKRKDVKLNRTVVHMASESYINAILEPVRHNTSHEEAIENLNFLCAFYTGGWKSVFHELLSG